MDEPIPIIDLSRAPGSRETWGRPLLTVVLWMICERLFVRSAQPSSRLRAAVLRKFGATIGEGVIIRPGVRVKSPWKLHIGARSWIGEDVWFHNQDSITVGSDVVISQGTFLTAGTHAYRTDMGLQTAPISLSDGVWITSRCVVLAGSVVGRSSLVLPNTVVRGVVDANKVVGTPAGTALFDRFG